MPHEAIYHHMFMISDKNIQEPGNLFIPSLKQYIDFEISSMLTTSTQIVRWRCTYD